MAPNLENLAQWNVQIALLAIAAAVVMHLLRIDAPVIRHAFWRIVLVACLALPVLQPWRSSPIDPSVARMEELDAELPTRLGTASTSSASAPVLARVSTHMRANWRSYVGMFLAIGAILRLAWLLIGIHGLQRLRRSGERAPNDDEYDELAALIEAGAEIRRVPRLGQPVTFGVLKPAVLLPASFSALPAGVQRAVLAHELWHVRRRDWAWVLVEEGICAVFWFNPAMWWLVSRVQSSREEVVDELTVQLTNARKTYMEALLAFADQPTLYPATPFARRRHLFHRMVLISTEAAMSSRRIVGSSVAMAVVLLATGLYASSRFPLKAEATLLVSSPGQTSQNPPRDRRPGEAGPETARERELKAAIAAKSTNSDLYFQLAEMQRARGARSDADATMAALTRALPDTPGISTAIAQFYQRSGQFDRAIATLEDAASANPSNAEAQQLVAMFYWENAVKDQSLPPADRLRYLDAGMAATDRALAQKPDYVDALTYKNILLRMKANLEPNQATRQLLIAEADALRARAMELRKSTGQHAMAFVPASGQPPPPPPPPPPSAALVDGKAPLRVGGNIKPPSKVTDVKPIYPPEAQAAGVQGVVILEATIDTAGNIFEARVLRGQPLLDQAALDAVKQWQFQPTMLNNELVPVIMTVTVNFTLGAPQGGAGQDATLSAPPPPPPPPPQLVDGQTPIRVGGSVKPPVKVRDVTPVYPAIAQAARVQGVVIFELTIDTTGDVANARVLRGQPLLDQAALEAVKQWQFQPTMLNGVYVPVIMTATVNFTVPQ
jgi:TonB family protein